MPALFVEKTRKLLKVGSRSNNLSIELIFIYERFKDEFFLLMKTEDHTHACQPRPI